MANKYQTLESGKGQLKEATVSSTGVAEAGDIVALDTTGKLDPSLLPVGVGADVKIAEASENLSPGDYVNFWDDGGTEKVRLADNSNGRDAHGFVIAAVTSGSNATVYFEGSNANLSGLTAGQRVYLGVTGDIITTPLDPVTDAGKIHQFLGVAVDATTVNTDIDDCIGL